jgi:hypothetical protein
MKDYAAALCTAFFAAITLASIAFLTDKKTLLAVATEKLKKRDVSSCF